MFLGSVVLHAADTVVRGRSDASFNSKLISLSVKKKVGFAVM